MTRPVAVMTAAALACTLAGCSGTSGNAQADALEACKAYTNGTTGVETAGQRSAALAKAQDWARKAASAAPEWQPLLEAFGQYQQGLQQAGKSSTSTLAKHLLDQSRRVIISSCEAASKSF